MASPSPALWAEHFNVGWLMRAAQDITGRVNTTLSFWLIVLVYVAAGTSRSRGHQRGRIEAHGNPEVGARAARRQRARPRPNSGKYMLVRTQMSVITGVLVWRFRLDRRVCQFALEWGVIAFALNYIPFIGPFIATLFPTLLALTQFGSLASGARRLRLPQHDPVRGRQLCRAARLRQRAVDLARRSCCSRCSSGPFCGACSAPSSACRSRSRS